LWWHCLLALVPFIFIDFSDNRLSPQLRCSIFNILQVHVNPCNIHKMLSSKQDTVVSGRCSDAGGSSKCGICSLLGNPSTSTRTSAPHIVRIIHQYNNVDLIRGLNCLCFWIWYLIFDSMDQNTIWPPLESSLRALSISTTINIKRFAASFSLRSNSQNLNTWIGKKMTGWLAEDPKTHLTSIR